MSNPEPAPKHQLARCLCWIWLSGAATGMYVRSFEHPDASTFVMALMVGAAVAFLGMAPK